MGLWAGPGDWSAWGFVRQDWKRSKKIQTDAQQQMKPPLSHLPDCNFFAYALQECVFSYIFGGGDALLGSCVKYPADIKLLTS